MVRLTGKQTLVEMLRAEGVDVVVDDSLPIRDIQDDYRPFAPKR